MADNAERNRKIEAVARAIARGKGFDPDQRAAAGGPLTFSRGYLIPRTTFALWQFYINDAACAVDALEQEPGA